MVDCRSCVYYGTYDKQVEKKIQHRFQIEGNKWRSKNVNIELVTVTEYYCRYYHENIKNLNRAEKCKKYTERSKQTDITTFIDGNQDIRMVEESEM